MRWGMWLVLAAGCSFSATPGQTGDGDGDGDGDDDARITDGIAADLTCPTRNDLLACYRFDLSTLDDTGNHHATVADGQIEYVAGVDGTALSIVEAATISIDNSSDFETDGFTVEFWIGPDFGQGFVFDYDGRFGVRIYGSGVIRCLIEAGSKQSAAAVLVLDRWNHVACTFDPNPGLQIFVDQAAGEFVDPMVPLDTPNTDLAHIGSDSPGGGGAFIGRLDNLRVWNRGLESDELCRECDQIGDPNP